MARRRSASALSQGELIMLTSRLPQAVSPQGSGLRPMLPPSHGGHASTVSRFGRFRALARFCCRFIASSLPRSQPLSARHRIPVALRGLQRRAPSSPSASETARPRARRQASHSAQPPRDRDDQAADAGPSVRCGGSSPPRIAVRRRRAGWHGTPARDSTSIDSVEALRGPRPRVASRRSPLCV